MHSDNFRVIFLKKEWMKTFLKGKYWSIKYQQSLVILQKMAQAISKVLFKYSFRYRNIVLKTSIWHYNVSWKSPVAHNRKSYLRDHRCGTHYYLSIVIIISMVLQFSPSASPLIWCYMNTDTLCRPQGSARKCWDQVHYGMQQFRS